MALKILISERQVTLHNKVDDVFGKLYVANRKVVSTEDMNVSVQTKAKLKC